MRKLNLAALLLVLSCHAAEPARVFPLWDGHESVESYALRVNLPPTKSLELGNGVMLDLVLIPAGQFTMGTPEPAKPTATIEGSQKLLATGGALALLLILVLIFKMIKRRKRSFSLRWLMLFAAACGLAVGGGARWHLAIKEAARYKAERAGYDMLPGNEKPGHLVTITHPFYMGKYTVTQAQYKTLTGRNPSDHKGAQLPVDEVSLDDTTAFCKKLNELFRSKALEAHLPTEAQWEFACRAGTKTRFYSGDQDSDLDAVAWYGAKNGDTTHPVGEKKPNAFGLYDMHGNAWQWCRDAYTEGYDPLEAADPFNEKGAHHVLRGGAWGNNSEFCRSTARIDVAPDYHWDSIGFRVMVTGL